MGANAQVALEKFARYFDVETRLVPVSEKTNYTLSPDEAIKFVDENTIGVFVILGSYVTRPSTVALSLVTVLTLDAQDVHRRL